MEPRKLLTIGGSDSGGAAGIQADLKTWNALGVYGMSVITVVTAQNSAAISGVEWLSAEFVELQLNAILDDYGADAIKTGFIGQSDVIVKIAHRLADYPALVVDPVLVNHRGEPLFPAAVADAYRQHLLPRALLATPNWREAALLAGITANSFEDVINATQLLFHVTGQAVLVTGWTEGAHIVDLFHDGEHLHTLTAPRIETGNTHGSGDTLSAAIAAFVAQGVSLAESIERARHFTARAIEAARAWRLGAGHGPLWHTPDMATDS